jgi:citrate synthase
MLNGEKPTDAMSRALDVCLIIHADHGLNASTFTARAISSSESDLFSAISGAVGSLKGPLHGGANEQVMALLKEIGSVDRVDELIRGKMERKEKVMGFGHRVYKTHDPRATYLKTMARDLAEQTGHQNLFDISQRVEEVMAELVAARGIYPNVDFYSATTYRSIGFEVDLFTPIFAVSRVAGWIGQVIEQHEDNRIMRPKAKYIGPHDVRYVPLDQRRS